MAWLDKQGLIGSIWYPIKESYYDVKCKENVHLSSRSGQYELNEVPVDLVPCVVEKTQYEPDFYITVDETSPQSVFVVASLMDKNSGSMEYFLNMHITNVTPLMNAMSDNLMVETL